MFSYDLAQKKLVLRQLHVEGFVTVRIENIPPGYRAKESYQWISADEFRETFYLAEPGKDFAIYSQTSFRRK